MVAAAAPEVGPVSQLLVDYLPIVVAVVLFAAMMGGMLVLNYVLGPRRPSETKRAPFEAGEVPVSSPRRRFSVAFYLVGIFFVVFDIEAVFLFPWAVRYRAWLQQPELAALAFGEMFLFVGILALGLLYVWKRGGLEWD